MTALFGFATFALGGIPCLIATLLIFARHLIVQKKISQQYTVTHSLDTVCAVAMPTLGWLALGRSATIPYEIAQFGAISTLALVIGMLHTGTQKHLGKTTPSLLTAFLLTVLVLLPALTLNIPIKYFLPTLALTIPTARFYFYSRKDTSQNTSCHWIKLGILAAFTSATAMLPILL